MYFAAHSVVPYIRLTLYVLLKDLFLILVNNQLTHSSFFHIHLFQFSTCFEHPCAHHQGNQLYQYDICFTSLYVQTCTLDGHLHRVTYTRCHINPLNAKLNLICHLLALLGAHHIFHVSGLRVNTIDSPYDEHRGARNM